jgi:integrase
MKENEENFTKYSREMLANGFSSKTLHVDAWVINILEKAFMGKRFEDLTKDDFVRFFAEAPSKWRIGSVHLMKARVKHFFAWLYGCEPHEFPACVKWIRINNPGRGSKTKGIITSISLEDVLKDEDVTKLVDAADHPRSKALIMVLYESAAEAQELLNMKVKDVIRDREHVKVALHGEAGVRYIRVHHASPYLFQWLNIHPKGEDPDAPLWNMSYSNLHRTLGAIRRKSGIKKPVSARALRHAGLTKWAKVMPEQLLKLFAGWRPDSKMASIYVHLSGGDLDEKLGEAYGEQPLEQKEFKIEGAQPIKCARCKTENPAENLFCWRCGMDLEPVPYDSVERRFQEIRDNPDKWMEFVKWYREKGYEKQTKQDSF